MCLPLLIFSCAIKSRSSVLVLDHPGRKTVVVVVVVPCTLRVADGPTSVFGSSRASYDPLGADQSSGVPVTVVSTLSSVAGVSSISQINNQSPFASMPTNEVQLHSFSDTSGTATLSSTVIY